MRNNSSTRALIAILVVTMALPSCATRSVLIPIASPKAAVASVPPGARVEVTLNNGEKVRGTVLSVSDQEVVIRPRNSKGTSKFDFSSIREIRYDNGVSTGRTLKNIAIGYGIAFGFLFGLVAIICSLGACEA